jgi:hypothetical protein
MKRKIYMMIDEEDAGLARIIMVRAVRTESCADRRVLVIICRAVRARNFRVFCGLFR